MFEEPVLLSEGYVLLSEIFTIDRTGFLEFVYVYCLDSGVKQQQYGDKRRAAPVFRDGSKFFYSCLTWRAYYNLRGLAGVKAYRLVALAQDPCIQPVLPAKLVP